MTACPACGHELIAGAVECPHCGVVLGRWHGHARQRPDGPPRRPAASALPPAARGSTGGRLAALAAIGVVLGLAVVAVYWYVAIRPRARRIENPYAEATPIAATARAREVAPDALFDRSIDLPGDPLAAVWTGSRFLIGNRQDPWGLLVVEPTAGDRWQVTKVPIVEPTYSQRLQLWALTWNGVQPVGYTDGAWFQQPGAVFVLLDPRSHRIVDRRPAPDHLGCLAWDGAGYWAATRRDTEDADQPAFLYRFDAALREVARYPPPAVGCQGLAWDGTRLWFADVFTDRIYLLSVGAGAPSIVAGDELHFSYLSGLAWDGRSMWVTEYDQHRLHRLNPILQRAWAGATSAPSSTTLATLPLAAPGLAIDDAPPPLAADAEAVLRQQLRSADDGERTRARFELERHRLLPDYDRATEAFPQDPLPADAMAARDWSVELRAGTLLGSWEILFGGDLFAGHSVAADSPLTVPRFVRFTITVRGQGLAQAIERTFDGTAGGSRARDEVLATDLPPGSYRVELFLHAQFVDAAGTNRILNSNERTLEVGY